jgi:hypothetical protein
VDRVDGRATAAAAGLGGEQRTLPGHAVPNLATRVLRLALDRLSADWEARYKHPLAVVETFVDPEQFQGTLYRAGGWVELGWTRGCRRASADYYVKHHRPKRLFVRELCKGARRGLQAEHLKRGWAAVGEKVAPRCRLKVGELTSLAVRLKAVPDFRVRIQSYPVWSLLGIVALAYLCGAPRGQKDLAAFARSLSMGQRRALGIRRDRPRHYPAPSQPTFCRLLRAVDARRIEEVVLDFQEQLRSTARRCGAAEGGSCSTPCACPVFTTWGANRFPPIRPMKSPWPAH